MISGDNIAPGAAEAIGAADTPNGIGGASTRLDGGAIVGARGVGGQRASEPSSEAAIWPAKKPFGEKQPNGRSIPPASNAALRGEAAPRPETRPHGQQRGPLGRSGPTGGNVTPSGIGGARMTIGAGTAASEPASEAAPRPATPPSGQHSSPPGAKRLRGRSGPVASNAALRGEAALREADGDGAIFRMTARLGRGFGTRLDVEVVGFDVAFFFAAAAVVASRRVASSQRAALLAVVAADPDRAISLDVALASGDPDECGGKGGGGRRRRGPTRGGSGGESTTVGRIPGGRGGGRTVTRRGMGSGISSACSRGRGRGGTRSGTGSVSIESTAKVGVQRSGPTGGGNGGGGAGTVADFFLFVTVVTVAIAVAVAVRRAASPAVASLAALFFLGFSLVAAEATGETSKQPTGDAVLREATATPGRGALGFARPVGLLRRSTACVADDAIGTRAEAAAAASEATLWEAAVDAGAVAPKRAAASGDDRSCSGVIIEIAASPSDAASEPSKQPNGRICPTASNAALRGEASPRSSTQPSGAMDPPISATSDPVVEAASTLETVVGAPDSADTRPPIGLLCRSSPRRAALLAVGPLRPAWLRCWPWG